MAMTIPQSYASTPGRALTFAGLAVLAFGGMWAAVDAPARGLIVVIGGGIIIALVVWAVWLGVQQVYGESVLRARETFALGQRFSGAIETSLRVAPDETLVHLLGWTWHRGSRSSVIVLDVRNVVSAAETARTADGSIAIPFAFDVPDDAGARRARVVKVTALERGLNPYRWRATFDVVEAEPTLNDF